MQGKAPVFSLRTADSLTGDFWESPLALGGLDLGTYFSRATTPSFTGSNQQRARASPPMILSPCSQCKMQLLSYDPEGTHDHPEQLVKERTRSASECFRIYQRTSTESSC